MKTIAIMMGVSGSGKTTVAVMLAGALGVAFLEGDDLHPRSNVEKMRSGTPLTDEDRWPWLRAIAARIDQWRAEGKAGVVTCSALKRSYRDVLIGGRPEVRLVYLRGSPKLIHERIAARHEHFMPAGLLDSQFATLEEPGPDERPIVVDVGGTPEQIVAEILRRLGAAPVPV
ncbi:MAG TPA: gluconokinase [Reyranella sp.]|jgi:carbohydrate kinase (thermoresistant glucokinase family)